MGEREHFPCGIFLESRVSWGCPEDYKNGDLLKPPPEDGDFQAPVKGCPCSDPSPSPTSGALGVLTYLRVAWFVPGV